MCCFAYTQHVQNRHNVQAFPPLSPVSGAVPSCLFLFLQVGLSRMRMSLAQGMRESPENRYLTYSLVAYNRFADLYHLNIWGEKNRSSG